MLILSLESDVEPFLARISEDVCSVWHVNYQFDLPSHDLYLPRAIGQLLMSIPDVYANQNGDRPPHSRQSNSLKNILLLQYSVHLRVIIIRSAIGIITLHVEHVEWGLDQADQIEMLLTRLLPQNEPCFIY